MSIETWMAEFYPVPADQVPREEAIAASLGKWKGYRKEARDEHGTDGLPPCSDSCPLCAHYLVEGGKCGDCPLFKLRGMSCDRPLFHAEIGLRSPYAAYIVARDPEPMIALLEAALAAVQKQV